MKGLQQGITLIELVIAVAVTTLVLTLGVPGYQALFGSAQRSAVITEISISLMYGRSEAVRRALPVSLCAGDPMQGCDREHPSDWSRGWIVFLDVSGNRHLDDDDEVLRVHHFKAPHYRMEAVGDIDRGVTFRASGFAHHAGGFNYCERGERVGQRIELSAAGQIQVHEYPGCVSG